MIPDKLLVKLTLYFMSKYIDSPAYQTMQKELQQYLRGLMILGFDYTDDSILTIGKNIIDRQIASME